MKISNDEMPRIHRAFSGAAAAWPLTARARQPATTAHRAASRPRSSPIKEKRGAATPPSPCGTARSARCSPRSRRRDRPPRCRAGISDRYNRRLLGRSRIADRHRRTSCDAAPERSPALRRRRPGTPFGPLRSASCGACAISAESGSVPPEQTNQPVHETDRQVGVVHVDVDRGLEPGGDAFLSRRMRAICVAARSRVINCRVPANTPDTGRISAIVPGMRRLPNSTKTSFPTLGSISRSLGIYQSTKMSVGSRISAIGVPATSDWPACARPVETIPATGAWTRPWRSGAPPLAGVLEAAR